MSITPAHAHAARRVTRAATATLASALLTGTAFAQAVPAQARAPKPTPTTGFVVDSTLDSKDGFLPEAIHSPAPGEVWLAGRTANEELAVARKVGDRWQRTVLKTDSPFAEPAVFTGSGRNLWMTAGFELWRYDGRSWKRIEVPVAGNRNAGKVSTFAAVAEAPGGAYVTYALPQATGGYNDHVGWTDGTVLKRIDPGVQKNAIGWERLRSQGGVLFAERNWNTAPGGLNADLTTRLNSYDGKKWRDLGPVTRNRGSQAVYEHTDASAWVVTPSRQNLFLGSAYSSRKPTAPYCRSWTPTRGLKTCRTVTTANAAAALRNNQVLIGSNPITSKHAAQPFFLRATNGRETVIPGKRFGQVQRMSAEPVGARARTQRVWALSSVETKQSGRFTYTVQRYDAKVR